MTEKTSESIHLNPERTRVAITIELIVGFLFILLVFFLVLINMGVLQALAFSFVIIVPLATFILGPFWGFLLYFPTTFVLAIPLEVVPFTLNQLAGALFIIGWLRWWWQGKARIVPTRYLLLLIVVIIYFSLSALLGEDPAQGVQAFRYLMTYFILSLVIVSMLNSRGDINTLSWIILIVTFAHALIGFYEFFSGVDVLVPTRARFLGTFRINAASPSAVVYGHYLVFAFPFGYYLFSELKNPVMKLVALCLTLFVILVSVLTLSRQVIIILAFQFLLIPLLFKNRFSKIFLVIVVLVGLISAPYVAHRIVQRFQTAKAGGLMRDRSVISRTDAFKVMKRIVQQKPFFGIGLGSFPTRWAQYVGFDTYALHFDKNYLAYTDCTYTQLLSETGLVGFVLALSIYINVIVIAAKKRREGIRQKDWTQVNFSSTILVLIFALLMGNIAEDSLLGLRSWLICALVLVLQKWETFRQDEES
ncbi:O-antigen ligase family protein [Candidatus Sumerlaeota bacterium]|nr:O-antigen ligase family protein [Candidatus Sumerlaeota bacterium]